MSIFTLRKPVQIDLSHMVGQSELSINYEIFVEDKTYEYRSTITIGTDVYDCYYIGGDMIMKYNDEYYYMVLQYSDIPQSSDEYDTMIHSLETDIIVFKGYNGEYEFNSLTGNELLYGQEYVHEGIEESEVDVECDVLLKILERGNEYMMTTVVDGELLMYIGIKIERGQIL